MLNGKPSFRERFEAARDCAPQLIAESVLLCGENQQVRRRQRHGCTDVPRRKGPRRSPRRRGPLLSKINLTDNRCPDVPRGRSSLQVPD
jgi:hypothetical protein